MNTPNLAKFEPHDAYLRLLRSQKPIVSLSQAQLLKDVEKGVFSVRLGGPEIFHVYRRGKHIGSMVGSYFSAIRGYENMTSFAEKAVTRFIVRKFSAATAGIAKTGVAV